MFNYGTEDIVTSAKIEIYKDGNLLQVLNSDKARVESLKQETIRSSAELPVGRYHAKAIVDYGKTIVLEEDFVVGKPKIEIIDVYADRFMPYEIAKIHIKLRTDWYEPIEDVRGEIMISKGNNIIDKIDTETFSLSKEREVLAFWENKGAGNYSARLNIIYGDSMVSKEFYLVTSKRSDPFIIIMLIVLLIILIAEVIREINHGGPIIRLYNKILPQAKK